MKKQIIILLCVLLAPLSVHADAWDEYKDISIQQYRHALSTLIADFYLYGKEGQIANVYCPGKELDNETYLFGKLSVDALRADDIDFNSLVTVMAEEAYKICGGPI